ncbi:hypothetical protein NL676_024858 [Syzygium grande]|nr:hypothetical protein NL676_024858 [Syzygium grande]
MDVSRKFDLSYDAHTARWRGMYCFDLLMLVLFPPHPQRLKDEFIMECGIEAALCNGFDGDPFPPKNQSDNHRDFKGLN